MTPCAAISTKTPIFLRIKLHRLLKASLHPPSTAATLATVWPACSAIKCELASDVP